MAEVGVVIARFQTPYLHGGHRHLLREVARSHADVLVLLGVPATRPTARDPLDFVVRAQMLRNAFDALRDEPGHPPHWPTLKVAPVYDILTDDQIWSDRVDAAIASAYGPDARAALYGSRDSFIPHYHGRHRIVYVEMPDALRNLSSTELRTNAGTTLRDYRNLPPQDPYLVFRHGVIYGVSRRPPISYQTVDVAIVRYEEGARSPVLMGKRLGESEWRFIGGFVDAADQNLEMAARREVAEEANGIAIDGLTYLGSFRVDDPRYRGTPDSIMTAFFVGHFQFGSPRPSDDLNEVEWVSPTADMVVPEHRPMLELLRSHLRRKEG